MSEFCVGLTGNIGSGKSTVAAMFATLGITVLDADKAARKLTMPGTPELAKIAEHFGPQVLQEDATLNREALRAHVFANPESRQWLENLLHPAIRRMLKEDAHRATSAYCMVEIPLLYDRAPYPWIARVLLVEADVEHQIARLQQHRQQSRAQTLAILATQPDTAERKLLADDVLTNNASLKRLETQVHALHLRYLDMAKNYEKQDHKK